MRQWFALPHLPKSLWIVVEIAVVCGLALGLATHFVRAEPETIPPNCCIDHGPLDQYALLSPDGQQVTLTESAPTAQCPPPGMGQPAQVQYTLTQPPTGASGELTTTYTCTGSQDSVSVTVAASSTAAFAPGPVLTSMANLTSGYQWLGVVTLVTALPAGPLPLAPPSTTVLLAHDPTLGSILTDWQGFTLYVNSNDPPGQSTCTGDCATTWLPLQPPPAPVPPRLSLPPGVPGALGVITRDDGTQQLTYNHQPLYYYSGDNNLGDTNGQGIGGIWSVVTPQAGP